MLRQRIVTAAVLLVVALSALFLLPGWAWTAALGLLILAGAREWSRLADWSTAGAYAFLALVAASGTLLGWLALRGPGGDRVVALVCAGALAFWVFAALPWLARLRHVRGGLSLALAGWWVLVPAWVAGAWLQSRPWLLLALLAVVWISDTAAFFSGRAFGRHKLAPAISPGKTWEGVAGAMIAVVLIGLTVAHLGGAMGLQAAWLPSVLVAGFGMAGAALTLVALVGLSIVGDLHESLLKRQAGVKDSGGTLPGHGGVLDRIDALIPTMPAVLLLHRLAA